MGQIRFSKIVGFSKDASALARGEPIVVRIIHAVRLGACVFGAVIISVLLEGVGSSLAKKNSSTENVFPSTSARGASVYSSYLHSTLSSVNHWQRRLKNEKDLAGIDRQVVRDSLLEGLTWLYEVGKLVQVLPRINKTLSEGTPQLVRFGFDTSGFYSANLTRLELKKPIFDDYTLFLLRLENRSPYDLILEEPTLTIFLTSGIPAREVKLTDTHPLYPHLRRIAGSFSFPQKVSPGSVISVKSIFDGRITEDKISYALVSFSGFHLAIKFYENIMMEEVK